MLWRMTPGTFALLVASGRPPARRLHARALGAVLAAAMLGSCADPAAPPGFVGCVRVVTFGDSNTDVGFRGRERGWRIYSYISNGSPRVPASGPNDPHQLAGKIEARGSYLRAINHGIS